MKKIITLLLITATAILIAADQENLIRNPYFKAGVKDWKIDNVQAFTVVKGDPGNALSVKGMPDLGEKNANLRFRQSIKLPDGTTARDKFTFGVTVKAVRVSGTLTAAVYEINNKGKITRRHVLRIGKRSKYNWKKFTRQFSVADDTKRLSIFIVASYLGGDDCIELKDIYLHREKN